MKIKRKTWDKNSLIKFLDVQNYYDRNPTCEVLCHNEGCVFEVELKECNLSYMDIGEKGNHIWEAYWTYECPRCGAEIIITKLNFEEGFKH